MSAQGVLDWPSLWRRAAPRGAQWMVLEHDKPKRPGPLRPRQPRLPARSAVDLEDWTAMEPVKLGIIGCGNISDAYLKGAARSKLVAVKAVRRPRCRRRPRRRPPPTASRRSRSTALLADPEIDDRHQPHRAAGPCRGQPARRSRPASTSIRRSRSPSRFAEGQALAAAARAKGVRVGSRARHLPRRQPPGRAAARSTRAGSAGGRRAPPALRPRHGDAGTPTPPSSSSAAAGRCSTSAAIRSPSSSTCSARSSSVAAQASTARSRPGP